MLDGDDILNESRAFMELTTGIEREVVSGTLLCHISKIHSMYANCLVDLDHMAYDKTSNFNSVNAAREEIFSQKSH